MALRKFRTIIGVLAVIAFMRIFHSSYNHNDEKAMERDQYYLKNHFYIKEMGGNNFTPRIGLLEWEQSDSPDPYDNLCFVPADVKKVTKPLTPREITDRVAEKLGKSAITYGDIFEAFWLNMLNIDRSEARNIKIILGFTGFKSALQKRLNFSQCEYSNCVAVNPHRYNQPDFAQTIPPERLIAAADIILFYLPKTFDDLQKIPKRPNQYFGVTTIESPAFHANKMSTKFNGLINFTTTYSRYSTIPSWHMYKGCRYKHMAPQPTVDYSSEKSKEALIYLSRCNTENYDRMKMIKALSQHITVDVYGSCGKADTCDKSNRTCLYRRNKEYFFYLSFENSLCQDYITEKFWDKLVDDSNMVPVAMGGLGVSEYTDMAPTNSFIHVDNFPSVEKLGKYLAYLMVNPHAYNAYHRWREIWYFKGNHVNRVLPACELCRIANENPPMPSIVNLSQQYNDPKICRHYP